MTSPNPTHPYRVNTTASRERSTVPTNFTWWSSPSSWTPSTAGVPQFLLLLTAREDHLWSDRLAQGTNSIPRSHAPHIGGRRPRVPEGLRRWYWRHQNRLKWRYLIPALTRLRTSRPIS